MDTRDKLLGAGLTLDTLWLPRLWVGGSGQVRGRVGHAPGHLLDAVRSVVLVVHVARHVLEVVHVCADEHVAKLHEVAVCLVLHCGQGRAVGEVPAQGSLPTQTLCPRPRLTLHDPPGVQTPPDPLPLGLHHRVAADNSEGCALLGGAGARAHSQLAWVWGQWWERGMGTKRLARPSTMTINNLSPKRPCCPHLWPLCCQLKPELVQLTP